jgi:hypothetical protein
MPVKVGQLLLRPKESVPLRRPTRLGGLGNNPSLRYSTHREERREQSKGEIGRFLNMRSQRAQRTKATPILLRHSCFVIISRNVISQIEELKNSTKFRTETARARPAMLGRRGSGAMPTALSGHVFSLKAGGAETIGGSGSNPSVNSHSAAQDMPTQSRGHGTRAI